MATLEWDDARLFLALVRAKTLNDAAARVSQDRSTLSRRLSALERAIGAKLFVRGRDGLRATPTAERIRPHAERMELEANALFRAALDEPDASGIVRVAMTEAFASMLVAEGLLDLARANRRLVIEAVTGNRPLDLAGGEADIAVRLSPLRGASLRARRVASVSIGLFASPAYLSERGRARTKEDLLGHDALLPAGELARLPEARWLAHQSRMRVVFRSNSMPALVAAAVASHGIVALPIGWGDRERDLVRLFVLDSIPERSIWLVTHEEARGRAGVRIVTDHVASILSRLFSALG